MKGKPYNDLLQLATRAIRHEQLLKDRDRGPHDDFIENVPFLWKNMGHVMNSIMIKFGEKKIKFADDKGTRDDS